MTDESRILGALGRAARREEGLGLLAGDECFRDAAALRDLSAALDAWIIYGVPCHNAPAGYYYAAPHGSCECVNCALARLLGDAPKEGK